MKWPYDGVRNFYSCALTANAKKDFDRVILRIENGINQGKERKFNLTLCYKH
jgi:hypothetical protein